MTDKLKAVLDAEDWSIDEERDVWRISKYSPAGEDFSFAIDKGMEDDMIESILEFARDFDAEEHASMWIEHRGKNGVPNSIRELINDADDIKGMLGDLAKAISLIS